MSNAMFKVGDKVKVIEDLKGGVYYQGLYFNHSMMCHCGKVATITEAWKNGDNENRYELDIDPYYVYNDDMLESYCGFSKSDLKDGMVVEYRNGERRLVLNGNFVSDIRYCRIDDYTDDLINTGCSGNSIDVVKVYRTSGYLFGNLLSDNNLTLIWERKEEPEYTEMTVEEIEKKLGYKVKVIADK